MDYRITKKTRFICGISKHRILVLCNQIRMPETIRLENRWVISKTAIKPGNLRRWEGQISSYEN